MGFSFVVSAVAHSAFCGCKKFVQKQSINTPYMTRVADANHEVIYTDATIAARR